MLNFMKLTGAGALAMALLGGAAWAQSGTVAFLMPDQGSTRYEEHDFPGFKAEMEKLCPDCKVIYQNANADVALQQQQFNSVITQGAKVIVLDPVELDGRRLAGQPGAEPGRQGHRLRPADPRRAGRLLRLLRQQGDRQGDRREPASQHLKAEGVPTDTGGVLQINGSPTDAAAGLIHDGVHEALGAGGYKTLAEFDTPDWAPPKAQEWASGQITRFGDADRRRRRGQRRHRRRRHRGLQGGRRRSACRR